MRLSGPIGSLVGQRNSKRLNRSAKLIHKRTEVVWMNKHFQKAQKTNQIAITLTKKESKQKKLNPSRTKAKG
jgi:hypothetical protein